VPYWHLKVPDHKGQMTLSRTKNKKCTGVKKTILHSMRIKRLRRKMPSFAACYATFLCCNRAVPAQQIKTPLVHQFSI
jgi:hypothetical protein